jgi:ATP-dependent Clp protease protease subunit
MGIGIDDFVKKMYEHRSTGDWREFGDAARKVKWVDEIVDTIREESYVKNPDAPPPLVSALPMPLPVTPVRRQEAASDSANAVVEQVDSAGHHYLALPRLDPVDCYYLYNPDGYFRPTP